MTGSATQTNLERLEELLSAGHPCICIETHEEPYAMDLIFAAVEGRSEPLWFWTAVRGVYPGLIEAARAIPETENAAGAFYYLAHELEEPALCVLRDVSGHLQDPRTLRALREMIHAFRENGGTVILLEHDNTLPAVIKSEATEFEIKLPDEEELERIAKAIVREHHKRADNQFSVDISKRDFKSLVRNLRGLSRRQAEQVVIDTLTGDDKLDADDIATVLAHKRQRLHSDGVLEYIKAPVSMDEIGGLSALKKWLDQRRKSLSDKALEFGITPPRGLLLLGVQGAGKSLASKAVATSWQMPLLRLDPGSLYDRYVGESERRLREALHQAEMMSPIVLWIDEIEKGFASAASQSTDGGLSQRMFGTLLMWMQEHRAPVFIVATANNIDALPSELLRKGRFDEIFFVDLPGAEVRKMIFSIHLKKRDRDPAKFDLAALAEASDGFSGAEIEQAVVSAMHSAFSEGVSR